MKSFIIVEDYTDKSIWDQVRSKVLALPAVPKGWKPASPDKPEADWTLACGMHQMATDGAYERAFIPKPAFSQLPAVFCVTKDGDRVGKVEFMFNVEADQAFDFITQRI